MKAFITLFKIEMKLAFREFSGVLFGVLLPLGIMVLLGILYGDKPAGEDSSYTLLMQGVPAVLTVGICATGLMGIPLTLSGYREKKLLKRFMVTPTTPLLLMAVQFAANLVTALISSALVLGAAIFFFDYRMVGDKPSFILMYLLVTFSIYSLGLLVASVSGSVKTANLLSSAVYFPMFFLSGATVPIEIMPKALQNAAGIMPLTQGIKLLKGVSLGQSVQDDFWQIIYLFILGIVCIIISVKTFRYDYQ